MIRLCFGNQIQSLKLKGFQMKLEKKESKNIAISSKVTEGQNEKLKELSEKEGMTKSALIQEMIKIGYMTYTKRKTF